MDRRTERETVFKMLFEAGFKDDENYEILYAEALSANDATNTDYIHRVFFGVKELSAELDEMISANAKGWKLNRISRVSRCIMRISIFEMKVLPNEIPFAVSINEAVELTKKYDDDNAPKFVNGILNSVAGQLGLKK